MKMETRPKYRLGSSTFSSISRMSSCYIVQKADSSEDMYAPDSIDLLKNSGIDFKRNEEDGINVDYFGELLITSGLVLFDNVRWISFHS